MTNAKSTKRALFASVMALLLSFSMLLGTTFAWFTDSVTSGNNIIKPGNLDIELEYWDGSKWADVKDASDILTNTLWEPGVTEVAYLRVANAGSLVLKYQLGINIEETPGKNQKGETFLLSDYLMFGVVEGVNGKDNPYSADDAGRAAAIAAVADAKKISAGYTKASTMSPDEELYLALVVYMPTDTDDTANHNGTDIPQINLGINVFATQMTAENDDFNNQYDAGAYLPVVYTEAELKSALESDKSVQLGGDIVLTGNWTPIGDKDAGVYYTGTLDGNGHTISGLNVGANDYDALISAAKDATIKNLTVEGTVNGVNAAGIVARVEGNTIIENCVSKVAVTGTTKAGGIVSNVTGADAKIINCVNNANVSCSKAAAGGVGGIVGYVNGNASVEIINCTNNGAVTGTDEQTTGAVIGNAGGASAGLIAGFKNTGVITGRNYVGDGLGRWIEDENGLVLAGYCATPANWTVAQAISTADELVSAFANLTAGDILYIAADIDMTGKTITPVSGNKGFTMLGGGHTISNLSSTAAGLFVKNSGSSSYTFDSVVLENCSVNSATNYGALFVGDADTSDAITITNCHAVNCTVKSAKYAAAFVAYTAGWNKVNDGPVYSDITIADCSVTGGSITGGGSVGAAIGHSGGNDDTTNTITNLKVEGVAINGEDAEHTGIVVGTANVGDTIINNATYSAVTGNYNGLYGRFVPGTTGTLVIDGASVLTAATTDALTSAIASGETEVYLPAGIYTLPATTDKTITISGTADTVIDLSNGTAQMHGMTYVFDGVTIKGANGNYKGIFHASSVTYKNCGLTGLQFLYADTVAFENCDFDADGKEHSIWTYGADNISFTNCDFTYTDRAVNVYLDNGTGSVDVSFNGCTFTTNNTSSKGAVEINSSAFPLGAKVSFVNCTAPAYGTMVGISGWDGTNGASATVTVDGAAFTATKWSK